MGTWPYFLALFLFGAWVIGYIGTNAGGFIHILLVLAIITVLLKVINGRNVATN